MGGARLIPDTTNPVWLLVLPTPDCRKPVGDDVHQRCRRVGGVAQHDDVWANLRRASKVGCFGLRRNKSQLTSSSFTVTALSLLARLEPLVSTIRTLNPGRSLFADPADDRRISRAS